MSLFSESKVTGVRMKMVRRCLERLEGESNGKGMVMRISSNSPRKVIAMATFLTSADRRRVATPSGALRVHPALFLWRCSFGLWI